VTDGQPLTVRAATHALMRRLGLTTVFGNPGSTELPMFADFPPDFRYVLGLQESVATSMADGYAQATRRAAAVSLHSAAGIGHAMGALFTAHKNRTPLVVIAGQQARSLHGGDPYLYNEQPNVLASPYVKWSKEPARAEDVPAAIARAYYLAMLPPQGPTLVSVPVDDWDQLAELPPERLVSSRVTADPDLLAGCAEALASCARPVFVVGAEVDRDAAFDDLIALAERHQARVFAAPMSHRCNFPEDHPLFAGFLPPTHTGIAQELAGADLVLVVGAPVFTFHVAGGGPLLDDGARLFQLTEDPAQAAWTPVGTAVQSSVGPAVRMLLDAPAPERARPEPRALPARVTAGSAISTALLMQTVADVRPDNLVIVEEAPSSRPVMCERLPNLRAGSFYTCASGALGYALPAAVGHALARPRDRVVAVVGDGSAMYSIQALWTAAELGLPLTVLVVNNRSYATVDNFARRFGIAKPVGTRIGGLDFVELGRAQGCDGARVNLAAELADGLRIAFSSSTPYLLEVVVED
jgi:benzoylformate decarboxylase